MMALNFNQKSLAVSVWGLASVLSPLLAADDFLSEEDLYENDVVEIVRVNDPFESINRVTFKLNDFVYRNLVEPLADGYTALTPDPVEAGASNFFYNLKYPVRLAGNLLQGRLQGAWVETGRFAINTTVGVAGVFTPADSVDGFESIPSEDVGQAFGAWGIGEGPYLVLPLLGPSNLRELGGFLGDRAVNPWSQPFTVLDEWEWRTGYSVSSFVVRSPTLVERYQQMKGSAIDPYSALKNAYTQYRRAAVEK
jgi:phospholipid-binding lipoprotein MlaA